MRRTILTITAAAVVLLVAAPAFGTILPEKLEVVNDGEGFLIRVTMHDMSGVPADEIPSELPNYVRIYRTPNTAIDGDSEPLKPTLYWVGGDTYEARVNLPDGEWVVQTSPDGSTAGPPPVYVTVGGTVTWPWFVGLAVLLGAGLWANREKLRGSGGDIDPSGQLAQQGDAGRSVAGIASIKLPGGIG